MAVVEKQKQNNVKFLARLAEHSFISSAPILTINNIKKFQKKNIPDMCFRSQSNRFPFSDQSSSKVYFTNSGFNNFCFSSDTNIFPDENLKSLFIKRNSKESLFNDSDHPVSLNS